MSNINDDLERITAISDSEKVDTTCPEALYEEKITHVKTREETKHTHNSTLGMEVVNH